MNFVKHSVAELKAAGQLGVSGIVDSGCSHSCVGMRTLRKHYGDRLGQIKFTASDFRFKFAGGGSKRTRRGALLPDWLTS